MDLEISRGKIIGAQKVVVYGPEGIGKSTFLSHFPGVVFIDTEGSTKALDVWRAPKPTSWTMLVEMVKAFREQPSKVGTLAIDTADWAERLCIESICARFKVGGIEDFSYGKGYTYLEEEFGRLLNLLDELVARGVNVVIAAHSQMRKFEQPDASGAYDRWELKLEKKTAALLKEWTDTLLFANYETIVLTGDNKKAKASGGKRVMYAAHHPCWDAKNRAGLADKLPFEFAAIAHILPGAPAGPSPEPVAAPVSDATPQDVLPVATEEKPPQEAAGTPTYEDIPGIPPELADLMRLSGITPREVQHAVGTRGWYPDDMQFFKYPEDFVSGCLIGAWEQVKKVVFELREKEGSEHEL